MKRLLLSTAIVGLAALPTFAIAQTEQTGDSTMQEQSDTGTQTGTQTEMGTDMQSETETDSDTIGSDTTGSMDGTAGSDDTGSTGMTAGSDTMDEATVGEGHSAVDPATIEASEIEGAPVRSRDGEEIADVSEVMLTEDGSIQSIVVNVGGWLGIGAKPVEVPFDRVTLQTNDEDGEMSILIPMSEQELKDMPRYEKN